MAEYRIHILGAASQELERLDKPIGHRIVQRINWLAANLDAIRLEALTGDLAGLYKLRVGDYRVIYEVLWDEKIIRDPRDRSPARDLAKTVRKYKHHAA